MTRRTLIKSGAGLAAIIAAGKAPAALVRSMLAARGGMSARPLPYKKRVEWLQSTGLEYIDTGVIASSRIGYDLTVQFKQTNVAMGALVNKSGVNRFQFGPGNADWFFGYDHYLGRVSGKNIAIGNKNKCRVDTVEGKWNLEDLTRNLTSSGNLPSGSFDLGINYFLFARNVNGESIGYSKIVIYGETKFWQDGVLVRDYIPVIDKNKVACMYDRVTRQNCYTPQGAFIAGPDAVSAGGGGYKLICTRRFPARSWRPSRRFCTRQSWKEAA